MGLLYKNTESRRPIYFKEYHFINPGFFISIELWIRFFKAREKTSWPQDSQNWMPRDSGDPLQLRNPKNDFNVNFNLDDKIEYRWTVWIWRKIHHYYSTLEKMSWANAHLNLCKRLNWDLLSSCNFILRSYSCHCTCHSEKLNLEAPNLNCSKIFILSSKYKFWTK